MNYDLYCVLIIVFCSFSVEWWFYAMASSHSSSPVPQGSSSDVFFKKEVDPTKHIRPVQSLPDVCPKEPTGNAFFFKEFYWEFVIVR